jgi:hypothetical protein
LCRKLLDAQAGRQLGSSNTAIVIFSLSIILLAWKNYKPSIPPHENTIE